MSTRLPVDTERKPPVVIEYEGMKTWFIMVTKSFITTVLGLVQTNRLDTDDSRRRPLLVCTIYRAGSSGLRQPGV